MEKFINLAFPSAFLYFRKLQKDKTGLRYGKIHDGINGFIVVLEEFLFETIYFINRVSF